MAIGDKNPGVATFIEMRADLGEKVGFDPQFLTYQMISLYQLLQYGDRA